MRYDLIIFDNDGVLVDSEPISNRILAGYLTDLGHPTSYEESIRDYMGSAMHRVHELVLEQSGQKLPADFNDVFHARVFEAFRRDLQPVPGVGDVLGKLAAEGVPYCLASSGSHERIRVALHKTALFEHFGEERIFSSQDVGRGKPAPDLFLHAAQVMGIAPGRCAVVEDSPLGVQAAVAAGMDVYGFTAMTPAAKLGDANALFSEMPELLDLIV
ncbi:HAD family hydrolase [Streptomyces sp. SID13666]|uniref:HAD family hydrolase n=1 Tax=unclassified Streptomyces TaxID=2593676 RepID=UPI0013C061CC|nr:MULTISPECIES: HAD family hydrolase [unclassified Streptomyces]NEA56866.1 HAD family hydrolase [Streptomyces sp. SID13666]NEA75694.1 HAD family hydrolase [Streptomyces sp. SID13588]